MIADRHGEENLAINQNTSVEPPLPQTEKVHRCNTCSQYYEPPDIPSYSEAVQIMCTEQCETHKNCEPIPTIKRGRHVFNNFINMTIGNQTLEAMIDSGSGCCLISTADKSKLPESHIRKLPLRSKYIVGVGGKIQPILSRTEINVTIGSQKYKYAFNEVKDTKHTLIGADFLHDHNATHSHGTATITLKGSNTIKLHGPSSKITSVKVCGITQINPNTGTDIDVTLDKTEKENQQIYHLQTTQEFNKMYPHAKSIESITTNKTTRMRILNTGPDPIILYPNQVVAAAITIPEAACISMETLHDIDDYYEAVSNGTQLSKYQQEEAERLSDYVNHLMPILRQEKGVNETPPLEVGVNAIEQGNEEDSYTSFEYHPTQEELEEIDRQLEEDYQRKIPNRLEGVELNIGHPGMSETDKQEFKSFLEKYHLAFSKDNSQIGTAKGVTHHIRMTPGAPVITARAYRTHPKLMTLMQQELKEWITNGLVERSTSRFRSPMITVLKPKGGIRLCTDMRKLNNLVRPCHFPIQSVQSCLESLGFNILRSIPKSTKSVRTGEVTLENTQMHKILGQPKENTPQQESNIQGAQATVQQEEHSTLREQATEDNTQKKHDTLKKQTTKGHMTKDDSELVFCSLDMLSGYNQIEVSKEGRNYLTFITEMGSWRYTRLPQGFRNSAASFCETVHEILGELQHECKLIVYVDDLILCATNIKELMVNLRKIFLRLIAYNVTLSIKKSLFCYKEVEFLGHTVNKDGVTPLASRTQALENYPKITSQKEVRRFLGICNFYRKHVPRFTEFAKPLYELTKKTVEFQWTSEHQKSFDYLRNQLINPRTLQHANPDLPYHVFCDASSEALSYTIYQMKQGNGKSNKTIAGPICFEGRSWTPSERKLTVDHHEVMAILEVFRQYHHLMAIGKSYVYTDRKSILDRVRSSSTSKPLTRNSQQIQRYLMELSAYDIEYHFIRGEKNTCADGLSRRGGLPEVIRPTKTPLQDFFEVNTTQLVLAEARKPKIRRKAQMKATPQDKHPTHLNAVNEQEDKHQIQVNHVTNEQENKSNSLKDIIHKLKTRNQEDTIPRESRMYIYTLYTDVVDVMSTETVEEKEQLEDSKTENKNKKIAILNNNLQKASDSLQRSLIDISKLQQECEEISIIYQIANGDKVPRSKVPDSVSHDLHRYAIKDSILVHHYELRKYHRNEDYRGPLFWTQVVLPRCLRAAALKRSHEPHHQGAEKSFQRLIQHFWYPHAYRDVALFVAACERCNATKQKTNLKQPPLRPVNPVLNLQEGENPCLALGVTDIIGPMLPDKHGNKYILTYMNAFTLYPHATALPSADAGTVSKALSDFFTYHGAPRRLMSDLGSEFKAKITLRLGELWRMKNSFSSSRQPNTNGLVENLNKRLVNSLKKLCYDKQEEWSSYLNMALYGLRTTTSQKTGTSPLYNLVGYSAMNPLEMQMPPVVTEGVNIIHRDTLEEFHESFKMSRKISEYNILLQQEEVKKRFDKKAKNRIYTQGQLVFIHVPVIKPRVQSRKLTAFYKGLYKIKEVHANGRYFTLEDVSTGKTLPHTVGQRRLRPAYLPYENEILRAYKNEALPDEGLNTGITDTRENNPVRKAPRRPNTLDTRSRNDITLNADAKQPKHADTQGLAHRRPHAIDPKSGNDTKPRKDVKQPIHSETQEKDQHRQEPQEENDVKTPTARELRYIRRQQRREQ